MAQLLEKSSLENLRRNPKIAHYFRYALHPSDFKGVRKEGRLLGRFAAKPLYGRLAQEGRIDRSAGFNGQIAILFLPARARTAGAAELILTRMRRNRITLPNGRRNWTAIRAAADQAIREKYGR